MAHVLLSLNTWDKWIFVDEVSLLPLDALGNLARLTLTGAKFVLFGDYEGQFECVADRWSVSSGRVQQSQLLRDMVKSLWVKLTTYRRGDDEALFDFLCSLVKKPILVIDVAHASQMGGDDLERAGAQLLTCMKRFA